MILHGAVADVQLGPDLLVGQATGRQPQDLALTLGERLDTFRWLHRPGDDAWRDAGIEGGPAGGGAHGAHDVARLGGLEL